jgi:hypothetical protein
MQWGVRGAREVDMGPLPHTPTPRPTGRTYSVLVWPRLSLSW